MDLNLSDNPQPFFVPTIKGAFVKATDGKNINRWLCQNEYRAERLFEQEIKRLDPFVTHYGEITAVKAWTGYGNPPHNPYED